MIDWDFHLAHTLSDSFPVPSLKKETATLCAALWRRPQARTGGQPLSNSQQGTEDLSSTAREELDPAPIMQWPWKLFLPSLSLQMRSPIQQHLGCSLVGHPQEKLGITGDHFILLKKF